MAGLPGTVSLYQVHRELLLVWMETQRTPTEVSRQLAVRDENQVFSSAVWQRACRRCGLRRIARRSSMPEPGIRRRGACRAGELRSIAAVLQRAEGELEDWRATEELDLEKAQKYPQVQ